MEKENTSTILFFEHHPEAKSDISLLRTILTPLELLIFKFITHDCVPHTTRETYSFIIAGIFALNFFNDKDRDPRLKRIYDYLKQTDYYTPFIDKNKKGKILQKWREQLKDKSFTEMSDGEATLLTEAEGKHPSYEAIRSILENFQKVGIVTKRKTQGKEYWILHPLFYKFIKDKRIEVENL